MALLKVICWALIFIIRIRFPPGKSLATILNFQQTFFLTFCIFEYFKNCSCLVIKPSKKLKHVFHSSFVVCAVHCRTPGSSCMSTSFLSCHLSHFSSNLHKSQWLFRARKIKNQGGGLNYVAHRHLSHGSVKAPMKVGRL